VFRFSVRENRAHLIHWRAWGEEAFEEAKQRDVPVVLLVVAFWCGSCQRFDEGALSDPSVIDSLNESFIPLRVEEAQRPDVDVRYTQNGWPTVTFLTPDGTHLFSINSVEAKPFSQLLKQAKKLYEEKKVEIALRGNQKSDGNTSASLPPGLDAALVSRIASMVLGLADPVHGGYGIESKFPHGEANEFFLYLFEATGEHRFLDHVELTLHRMRESRMFDAESGGGFYRYSSRLDWQEPHPEKLLDDQTSLLGNYLHAYLLTGDAFYRDTATSLVDYIDKTLLDPITGVFFGCQDFVRPFAADGSGASTPPMMSVLDECCYCDQNARLAAVYLRAWWVLGREDCKERARHVLDWLWANLRDGDGGFYHYWDSAPRIPGLLNDTSAAGLAMLQAYASLGDPAYLQRALEIAGELIRLHRHAPGGFADISHPALGGLQMPLALAPLNATVASFFILLADLTEEESYRGAASWALLPFENPQEIYGALSASFGQALARSLAAPITATVAGRPGDAEMLTLAGAALVQFGQADLVLCFEAADEGAALQVLSKDGRSAWLTDLSDISQGVALYERVGDTPGK
jgi:uncharacterized protein YyaL (SSP411 family)